MTRALAGTVILVTLGVVGYLVWNFGEPPPEPVPFVEPQPEATAPAEPTVRYPIESEAAAASLPALDESDPVVGKGLAQLFGASALPSYIYPDKIIRRFVATIDNLPRDRASSNLMPVRPVAGAFAVTGADGEQTIDPKNAARYWSYIGVMESVAVNQLVDFYVRFYPLFQQAYRELGYPKGYFNDRLIETLDDLIAAPDSPTSPPLVRPNVLYQFADRELESLSAGKKIMIRMGSANAERVKTKLREVRQELISRSPKMQEEP